MKKLTSLLTICATIAMISSCKKSVPVPDPVPAPCNIVCNNGGTVNQNCGCDCPTGFTGTNCQTPVNTLTTLNVSINKDLFYTLPPLRYAGDNEYAGYIRIDGKVTLETGANNTKIYGVVNATYIENNGGDTKAKIDGNSSANRILLYTAPTGKKVVSINSYAPYAFYWYPAPHQLGKGELVANKFVYKIEMIGDTVGDDLPSDGTVENARFRIWFDDFNITIGNQ